MAEHGIITISGNEISIERLNDSKLLRNGQVVKNRTVLSHLDRIVFGTSQYYVFIDPAKITPKDVAFTFEMAQDEIAKASGLISSENKANLTSGFYLKNSNKLFL